MQSLSVLLAGALLLAGVALAPASAQASGAPAIGPVPSWVLPPPTVPTEKADVKGLPVTVLLNDTQLSFDDSGWTEYHDLEAKVQAAAGLQALGTIPFQWSPWSDTLTFHRARIIRGDQTIDILPKDGGFTVLRREAGLEQAMLTGVLTALLQPDGLQVGDVLEVAVSIRHADPLLKGRTGAFFSGWDVAPVGRFRLQAHWPSALPVRWRETAGVPPLRRSEANGVTTVSLNLDDVLPLVPPAHAPERFQHGREIEFTTFADWNQVAQLMAPLFAKAAELGPQSAVGAQAELIAKFSTDPKDRAAAALRLVEGEVRYLAHTEDAGGYTPQNADETWRLRYGDCKAKSVLLIALLQALGIPAEPALANLSAGDGLNTHLPLLLVFNHVVVRVRLGDRDYWLDGTRQGDRNLDDLITPAYGWVLPLGSGDGQLVHVGPAPATRPQVLQVVRYDASRGVTEPEPTVLETTFRGDAAFVLHTQLSAVPPERLDSVLKAFWTTEHTALTPTHVSAAWDPVTGEEKLTADGSSKLDWSGAGLELQNVELGGAPDIKRDPASSEPDAPYFVDFPQYTSTEESVVLPPGDTPSSASLKAMAVDQVVAGVAYRRTATLTGNVLRVLASQRSLQPEISAAEAKASVDPLTQLGKNGVFAPAGGSTQAANDAVALDTQPTTAAGHLDRGNALLDAGQYREALSEFEAATELDTKSQMAWADRAVARAWLSDPTALADADRADSLGAPEIVAARARGLLASNTAHLNQARAAFRQALVIAPHDPLTLEQLVIVELRSSNIDAARRDLDELMQTHPEFASNGHALRASIDQAAHLKKPAERELAQMDVRTAELLLGRAGLYLQLGDKDLARADADVANQLKPSAAAWVVRANTDGGYNSAAADGDIAQALKLAPEDLDSELWKANEAGARQDYAAELPIMDRLVREHPEVVGNLLVGRAQVEAELGRTAEMDADFTRARAATGAGAANDDVLCQGEKRAKWRPEAALSDCEKALQTAINSQSLQLDRIILLHRLGRADEANKLIDTVEAAHDANQLNGLCYGLASEDFLLDRALADCDASLKLRPKDWATLDSRGFVLMRLGRNAEAITAYNASLAMYRKGYNSMYGRGLAEVRLGQAREGARDITAALAARPGLRKEFADMGVAE